MHTQTPLVDVDNDDAAIGCVGTAPSDDVVVDAVVEPRRERGPIQRKHGDDEGWQGTPEQEGADLTLSTNRR
jgi:hypothetical protein